VQDQQERTDLSHETNMSSPKGNNNIEDIPDLELETARRPSPILTQLSQKTWTSQNNHGSDNNNHPAQGARCAPNAMMGWSQFENVVQRPFPAGMCGVPPCVFVPHPHPGINGNGGTVDAENSGNKAKAKAPA